MGRIALLMIALLAALPTAFVAPHTAAAQCRLCDEVETHVDPADKAQRSVGLSIETSLDFDRIVLIGEGDGSATLGPDGERFTDGVVAALSGRAMVGSVIIRGEAGRYVSIRIPEEIELYTTDGARLRLKAITSDLDDSPRLDDAGELRFRFGGQLLIEGDAEGDYRGEIPIIADYL